MAARVRACGGERRVLAENRDRTRSMFPPLGVYTIQESRVDVANVLVNP